MDMHKKYENDIIRVLEKITASGFRRSEIFDHWLELTEACLDELPKHLKSAIETGKLAVDSEENQKLFAKIRNSYGRGNDKLADQYLDLFAEATGKLLQSVQDCEYEDLLGNIYMTWEIGNVHAGQYFTPMPIAKMMAQLTMGDIEKLVYDRIKEALTNPENVIGQMVLMSCLIVPQENIQEYFFEKVLPAAMPFYKPVTVCDPCVGSGVMLLAGASLIPKWMTQNGLVQFFGTDIDFICVRMCRINIMNYGLNGSYIRFYRDLSYIEIKKFPEPFSSAYIKAKEQPEMVGMIAIKLKEYRQISFQI